MEKYLVVIQKGKGNYGAYSPDVLGCVAVGDSLDEVLSEFQSALTFHFKGMLEDGDELPISQGLQYWIDEGEISESDVLAFIEMDSLNLKRQFVEV